MTIPNTTNEVSYTTAGSASEQFGVPFRFFADADLHVFLDGTLQTLTTNYTVSGAGDGSGGLITWVGTPTASKVLRIIRMTTPTQGTDYLESGNFPAESHEDALDRSMATQQSSLRRRESSGDVWDAGSDRIINVTDPVDSQDAATKSYVNTQVSATTSGSVSGPALSGGDANKCLQVNAAEDAVDWTGEVVPAPVTADANKVLTASAADTFAWAALPTGARNLLFNGGMQVAQRGASFVAGANNDASYNLDRWLLLSEGNDIVDITQQTAQLPDGAYSKMRLDVETADKSFGIVQILEARDTVPLQGQKVSLRVDMRYKTAWESSKIQIAILQWTGTADSPTKDVVSSWAADGEHTYATDWASANTPSDITLTTSWVTTEIENIEISSSATNVAVFIYTKTRDGLAVGNLLEITNVQLQQGAYAADFQSRSFSEELALCQRYYAKRDREVIFSWKDSATSNRRIGNTVGFPQEMRAAPTVTYSNKTETKATIDDPPNNVSTEGFDFGGLQNTTDTGNMNIIASWTADAEF